TTNDLTAEGVERAAKTFFSAIFACSAVGLSSGERKEDLFQVVSGGRPAACRGERGQFREGALAADTATTQEHEPGPDARGLADAGGVADLVNREEHRPAGGGVRAQRLRDVAALTQVQALERLVGKQDGPWDEQPDGQQRALALALRQRADGDVEQRLQLEIP